MRRGGTQHALTEANEKLEKANAEFQRRVTALEGRAQEAEAALQESLQRQEKMAAMYEESILERATEEAADAGRRLANWPLQCQIKINTCN